MVNGKRNVEKDGGAIGIMAANSANFSIDRRRYYRLRVIDGGRARRYPRNVKVIIRSSLFFIYNDF